ncbi:MAG: hypothetical protein LKJ60_10700 [Lentilactobacillus buchneri]|nr:hypothetical protein [Lentilactobacillus buchneri]
MQNNETTFEKNLTLPLIVPGNDAWKVTFSNDNLLGRIANLTIYVVCPIVLLIVPYLGL